MNKHGDVVFTKSDEKYDELFFWGKMDTNCNALKG